MRTSNRALRRALDKTFKQTMVRRAINDSSFKRHEITPKWVGKTAATHWTCDCWMCKIGDDKPKTLRFKGKYYE